MIYHLKVPELYNINESTTKVSINSQPLHSISSLTVDIMTTLDPTSDTESLSCFDNRIYFELSIYVKRVSPL